MNPLQNLYLLIALTVFLLVVACEHQVTAYPAQPARTVTGVATEIKVTIVWVSGVDELAKHCGPSGHSTVYGCTRGIASWGDPNTGVCTIWAIRPKDFNDIPLLAVLGHELEHCTGSMHP